MPRLYEGYILVCILPFNGCLDIRYCRAGRTLQILLCSYYSNDCVLCDCKLGGMAILSKFLTSHLFSIPTTGNCRKKYAL
ncbi:hypothetical protein PNOK_0104800 [Pyrrhoderma noxium]|uniref:Uncharacterized protein n=1 Tax=Pyrrhoderma noxium TaxID=2282107 RepID=A0A286UWJ8_9AGAM|nr:hypothetical protein PNOK_0104800 [Pyrrhoderma noxium]